MSKLGFGLLRPTQVINFLFKPALSVFVTIHTEKPHDIFAPVRRLLVGYAHPYPHYPSAPGLDYR